MGERDNKTGYTVPRWKEAGGMRNFIISFWVFCSKIWFKKIVFGKKTVCPVFGDQVSLTRRDEVATVTQPSLFYGAAVIFLVASPKRRHFWEIESGSQKKVFRSANWKLGKGGKRRHATSALSLFPFQTLCFAFAAIQFKKTLKGEVSKGEGGVGDKNFAWD